jgi:hypothetical protein
MDPFVQEPGASSGDYIDAVIYDSDQGIAPGEERAFATPAPSCKFEAALFADGSYYGDTQWAARMVHHRKILYQVVIQADECLRLSAQPEVTFQQLARQLKQTQESLTGAGASREQRSVVGLVFSRLSAMLANDPTKSLDSSVRAALAWLDSLARRLGKSNPQLPPADRLSRDVAKPSKTSLAPPLRRQARTEPPRRTRPHSFAASREVWES